MGTGLTYLTSRLPGCLRHVAGSGVVRKRLARGYVHILHAPKPCTVLVSSAATTGLKHGRRNSCVGAAHRVELVRPIEASVAGWARRVAICAALGVHEVHTSPMALSWREPLMAARGRCRARRVPERVFSGRWIAARLPAVRLRRAGEQVAHEHGFRHTRHTRRERIPKTRIYLRRLLTVLWLAEGCAAQGFLGDAPSRPKVDRAGARRRKGKGLIAGSGTWSFPSCINGGIPRVTVNYTAR